MVAEDESEKRSYPPINESEDDLCRALWLAVVVQAMRDITLAQITRRREYNRRMAIKWYSEPGWERRDFTTVCDLAGIDFQRTKGIFEKVALGKEEVIDFRCAKRALLKNRDKENRLRYFKRARKNTELRKIARNRLVTNTTPLCSEVRNADPGKASSG